MLPEELKKILGRPKTNRPMIYGRPRVAYQVSVDKTGGKNLILFKKNLPCLTGNKLLRQISDKNVKD
jgi:hypothetical protein